jgi:hypothetical protein
MNIFIQIKNSIYNKDYYQNTIFNESLKTSIKYLAKLCLLIALAGLIIFSFSMPNIAKEIKNFVSAVAQGYPQDLIISLNKGEVSTNKEEPFFMAVPENIFKKEDKTSDLYKENLIVIDTKNNYSLEKFNEYSTFFLLAKKELITIKGNGGIEALPLSKYKDIEINKSYVIETEGVIINKYLPLINIFVFPLVFFALFIGSFIGSLIVSFWYALLVLMISKIKKIDLSYRKSYQYALHAITLISILGLFTKFVPVLNNILLKSFIIMVIIFLNFHHQEKKEEGNDMVENIS